MKYCLNKEIIDYTDDDFWELANKNNNRKLLKMFQDLRLKKDNTFAFIEVFDDWTFKNNFEIVKELVELLQKYKFKYNNKKQFLGDFFEELLNHSWKQEAGQFFTPLPIVEMMTNALPIKENIQNKLLSTKIENELLPKILDYACGSGHFLISSMDIIQKYIDNIDLNSIKINNYKNKIQSYKNDKYFWAKEYVYGIEKDYRLSKTTKIASFLNGDGEANVLNADALLKFDSEIFNGTIFYSKKSNNEIFDYIISNPPYSVKGFMKNFIISGIKPKDGTFEFLNEINYKNTNIESFFLERTYQLLKNNGFASIVLPQSFLTNDKYSEIRSWMLENFILKSIFLSGPNTFSGTTTSPVILFLQKSNKKIINLNYKVFVIHSPIMIDHNSLKLEKDFLGFFFSSNKNKKGITITNFHNLKDSYSENIKNMLLDKEIRNDKYSKVSLLNDLIIEDHKNKKAIFTRRNLPKKLIDYFILSDVCEERKIIESNENININQLNYIEISNINNNKLIGNFKKNMKSSNFCHKGDLLISSVAPKSGKVWISDGTYKVSSAIIVLKFNVESVRDYIFNYLKNNVDNIFANINSLSEGFKVTYSKISSWNLLNNIYFKKV